MFVLLEYTSKKQTLFIDMLNNTSLYTKYIYEKNVPDPPKKKSITSSSVYGTRPAFS